MSNEKLEGDAHLQTDWVGTGTVETLQAELAEEKRAHEVTRLMLELTEARLNRMIEKEKQRGQI